jgi:hypothetical protein
MNFARVRSVGTWNLELGIEFAERDNRELVDAIFGNWYLAA